MNIFILPWAYAHPTRFWGWMKYIHFTVGLRPPYEMLGRCDEIYSFDRGLMPTLRGFWVMR